MNDIAANAKDILKRIVIDGEPVTGLYDQWELTHRVELSDNISCLSFSDPLTGRSAVWYIDGTHTYCGSHIEVVNRLTPDDILMTVAPWLDHLARTSLMAKPQALPDILVLPYFLASQLALAWSVRTFDRLEVLQTSLIDKREIVAEQEELQVTATHLHRILQTRIDTKTLILLSPFSDQPLRSQMSFMVEHQLVHRFYDPTHDCSFYLAWWERKLDEPPTFYCPKLNLLVSDHGLAAQLIGHILGWYLSHPEHVAVIETAADFNAADFGLGHASTLLDEPVEETAPKDDLDKITRADVISDAWAFLQEAPLKTLPPAQPSRKDPTKGPLGWLRKVIGKKGK